MTPAVPLTWSQAMEIAKRDPLPATLEAQRAMAHLLTGLSTANVRGFVVGFKLQVREALKRAGESRESGIVQFAGGATLYRAGKVVTLGRGDGRAQPARVLSADMKTGLVIAVWLEDER